MIKILRIVNRFNLGGPTYNAAYLSRYLGPGFETMLVGGIHDTDETSSEFILRELGLTYQLIPEMRRAINPYYDTRAYARLSRIIRSFKPDIVHTHASKAGALGRMAAIRNGVPVIVHTFHGNVLESYFSGIKSRVFINIERYLADHSNRIIAISQNQKDDLVRILQLKDPGKVEIIPLGFDLSRFTENQEVKRKSFRDRFRLQEDEIAIGIIGRLVPIKNHSLFLSAVRFLKEHSNKKFRAFVIGDGYKRRELEKLAEEMGIFFPGSNVKETESLLIFTSWIKEMDEVMAGLDIVTLTSLNEGTPVSLIEAQAANKPVVTTRVGGIENAVWPGKTALLSGVGDKEGFCRNVLTMVEDDGLRKELGIPGWDFVRTRYHYTRLVKDMTKLYLTLMADQKHLK